MGLGLNHDLNLKQQMPLNKEYIAHVISFIYKKNFVAKQGLLFLLGENQKKGKRGFISRNSGS